MCFCVFLIISCQHWHNKRWIIGRSINSTHSLMRKYLTGHTGQHDHLHMLAHNTKKTTKLWCGNTANWQGSTLSSSLLKVLREDASTTVLRSALHVLQIQLEKKILVSLNVWVMLIHRRWSEYDFFIATDLSADSLENKTRWYAVPMANTICSLPCIHCLVFLVLIFDPLTSKIYCCWVRLIL